MEDENKVLLNSASNLTAAIARQIKSPKLDLEGLADLEQALVFIQQTLSSIRKSVLYHNT
jgi:hypothetical protein